MLKHVKETSSAKFSASTNFLFSLSLLHTLNKGIFHDITRYKMTTTEKKHVESTRATTRECGSHAESKNCVILLLQTAERQFDTKVKCPTGWASFWVKFPTVRSLSGGGGGWAVLELNGTLCPAVSCIKHSQ